MNPRHRGAIAANPVLVGAVTTLIVIVGVFLAYNANKGLPFVPTYDVRAALPNASGLIEGNEVRLGGARIGIVSKIASEYRPDGSVGAILSLKLDKKAGALPVDSVVHVRPRSPLGLKYVEVTRGTSAKTLTPNEVLDARNIAEPVEIDDFFSIFDTPTQLNSQRNLYEFGNGFAGRGDDLNRTFRTLRPLVAHLEPVMRNLMSHQTGWARLFPSIEQAAREAAPVAGIQADLWVALDRTFTAWSSVRPELQASITEGRPALATAIRELPAQARFVRDNTELFRRWRPAFAHLADASVDLAPAFRTGTPALIKATAFNGRLEDTMDDLQRFGTDPRIVPGLDRFAETARILRPIFRFGTPIQTKCNYLTLFFRNLASALSEADSVGSYLRVYAMALPQLAGSEVGPSALPANGPAGDDVAGVGDSYLHSNPYPNTAAPDQEQECEAGNETYLRGRQVVGNEPGNQTLANEATTRKDHK
ncbi:MAG: MlaD family protein [Solirubrobacteraceae bacterium]